MTIIQIYAERCTGSNYLEQLLINNCLNVEVTTTQFGHKHWIPNNLEEKEGVIYIWLTRNVYDWVRSFWLTPHNAPYHNNLTLSQFIRKPWRSISNGKDMDLDENNNIFKNVLQMRNYKNNYFLKNNKFVYHICYEELKLNTQQCLQQFANKYNITLKNNFTQIHHYVGKSKNPIRNKKYPPFQINDLKFINSEINFDNENKIKYHRLEI